MNTQRLQELASFVVAEAKRLGATDCDVTIVNDESVETNCRQGEIETLKGAQGRGLTFRGFVGQNSASTSSSDFRRRSLTRLVRDTVTMAKASQPDEFAGLPAREFLAGATPELGLYDEAASKLSPEAKFELAKACEAAALAADKRITKTDGASFSEEKEARVYANSRGLSGAYVSSACSMGVAVIAPQGEEMEQVGSWYTMSRKLSGLQAADAVGKKAAARALSQLGGRRVPSQKAPVIFDPSMAAGLLGQFAGAAAGSSIYRNSSFLVGKLGEKVAADGVEIIDDALMPGAIGSRPFTGEGLPCGKRVIVANGKLGCYFLDSYAGRKLKCNPNGGGATNLYIKPGKFCLQEIIGSVKSGLYLTSVSGPGFNQVTGDYSRGASGIWIENGELAFPVQEITIAGNVLEMLQAIEMVGNDLEFRSSVNAPTLKIAEMSIAGS